MTTACEYLSKDLSVLAEARVGADGTSPKARCAMRVGFLYPVSLDEKPRLDS